MDLVEAAAATRAMCRECGAAIRRGEPRYGRPEGEGEARRVRWRHLACAAQAMPKSLFHALELGGWRSVPEFEHEELRALIERGRRRPHAEDSSLTELSSAQAGRSSSAMAAAAVLEPAHEAEVLEPERARAWVLADALQTRGDARGELLALELAAEHTRDPEQARSLQREHRACWRRFGAEPQASKQLRLRWIGGFLRAAHPQSHAQLRDLLRSPAAQALERLRFDFCTQDELEQLVAQLDTRGVALQALELCHARPRSLAPLAQLARLERLRVSDRFDGGWLGGLPSLRALSLGAGTFAELGQLAACPQLEELELSAPSARLLDDLPRALPKLRLLRVSSAVALESLAPMAELSGLERLELPDLPLRELAPLRECTSLRALDLSPGREGALGQLGELGGLERVVLRGSKVSALAPLAELRHCTHLGLIGTRATALRRLRHMPGLRSLVLEGGDMRRLQGLERLRSLAQLGLSKLANLDLSVLTPLEQLETLVLTPARGRPQQLDVLATLPKLRRLSLALSVLESFAGSRANRALLPGLEVLELRGDGLPSSALLRRLPRLRRVLLPGRAPEAVAPLTQRHKELAFFVDLPTRDHLDQSDPFDWRTLGWVPRWDNSGAA